MQIQELLETLVKRVTSIERRLDNHVRFDYNCDLNDNDLLFMEVNLKKRLPEYVASSAADTNFITDVDVSNIYDLFQNTVGQIAKKGESWLEITVYTLEKKDWYDAMLRLNAKLKRSVERHDKVKLYENIERTIKMKFGDLYEITPVYNNKYTGYRLYHRRTLPLFPS